MKANTNILLLIIWLIMFLKFTGCKKDSENMKAKPTFYLGIDSITTNSAICSCSVTSNEKEDTFVLTELQLSEYSDFETSYSEYILKNGSGNFRITLKSLKPNTIYYVRLWAINKHDDFYSKKQSFATTPKINTLKISEITQTTAKCGGSFPSNGNANIVYKGICWSTSQNPTIANDKTILGSEITDFQSTLSGLSSSTRYFVRAYAVNTQDTIYGQQKTFITYPNNVIYDIDNNIYNTITIGTQEWMKEDLRVSHYRNGDLINTINIYADIRNEISPKYQWSYQRNDTNVINASKLYTWYTVVDNRGVCPTGWHLPSDSEWEKLISYLGGELVAGEKLREAGGEHWSLDNTGTNESGFTALPDAIRRSDGYFWPSTPSVRYLSSTESGSEYAWIRQLEERPKNVFRSSYEKKGGYSCRCIKD